MRISDWSSDVCSSDLLDAPFLVRILDTDAQVDQRIIVDRQIGVGAEPCGRLGAVVHVAADQPVDTVAQREDILAIEHDLPLGRVGERVRSEEHTSELQSLMRISYAVFCLKKKKQHSVKYNKYYYNKDH